MSLKTKLKRAFHKAHKFIIVFTVVFVIIACTCLSVSAKGVFEFDRSDILTEDTELHVTNGYDYATHWKPSLVYNWVDGTTQDMQQYGKNYVVAQYDINYYPPTGGSYNTKTTCVYLRLRELQGISVKKGERLKISFKIMYDGQINFDALTTRCQPQGWLGDFNGSGNQVTGESFRKNLGYVPPNSIGTYDVYWDNTYTDFKIDYFDINFLLYNNQSIDGKFFLWFFYDSLMVTVEDIPTNPLTDPNYSSPDGSAIQDHNNLANSLEDSTAVYRDEASSLFTFDSSDTTMNSIFAGVLAWTKVFNSFFGKNPWYNSVLQFSLSLGIFGFLFGLAIYSVGKLSHSDGRFRRNNWSAKKRNGKGGS